MSGRARLSIPDIPWHIIQRGNNGSVCFYVEGDYQLYLHYLEEFATQFGYAIHAYVLMTHHVHLLLTPQRAKVSVISVVCRLISCPLIFSQRLMIAA